MPIIVTCECGKRLQAPDNLAGKRTKCPHCKAAVQIPLPATDPGAADPLGLGDLSQYEPHAQAPPGYPGANPMAGNPLGAPGYDPLTGGPVPNQGWQPQAAPGYGWGQPAAPARKGNLGVTLAIVGVVGAVLVMLVCMAGVIYMTVVSGGREVAEADDDPKYTPMDDDEAYGDDSYDDDSNDDNSYDDDSSSDDFDSDGDEPDRVTTPTIPPSVEPMPPNNSTKIPPTEGSPDSPAAAPPPTFAAGIEKWRLSNPTDFRGAIPYPNAEHVIEHHSWQTKLLPYLGQGDLYRKIQFDKSWWDGPNRAAAQTLVPQFLNPNDIRRKWDGFPYEGAALTHYVGMAGVEDTRNVVAAMLPRSDDRAGMFGYDSIAKSEEVTDGLSSTIMIIGSGELAGPWASGGGVTVRGARQPYFDEFTGFGTRGLSQPGTLAVFADGSVREISANVDSKVFRAMCTIHGRETVDQSRMGKPLDKLPMLYGPKLSPMSDSPMNKAAP